MESWLERWRKRQIELAEGADADVVQSYRRRFKTAFRLLGVAVVLLLAEARIPLFHRLDLVLRTIAIICFLPGIVLVRWAAAERDFLIKPEPEKPPTVFKSLFPIKTLRCVRSGRTQTINAYRR